MASYEFLARAYDGLTRDVHYDRWADYLERQFVRAKHPIHTVLDLACGTGSLTRELALRGYELIGVDQSEDMLGVAAEKCRGIEPVEPIFLHQSMERLDLYGTIDACVCCLDSINYVTRPALLPKVFERVHCFLVPGGLFLFDINTPEKLRSLDGEMFIDESEDAYCVWRAEYAAHRRICTYGMDIFRREGNGCWRRGWEEHMEYAYEPEELEGYLAEAGFVARKQYGELKLCAPKPGEQRIFFTARKEC